MATIDPIILPPVGISTEFSVTIVPTPDIDESTGLLETITSVTASLIGSPEESSVIITPGTTSVTISGKHLNTFTDVFTYVSKGQSDKTETPTSVIGRGKVPPAKTLFNLAQDLRKSEIRSYSIVVNETQVFTVTQEVENALELMKDFMANYFNGANN